MKKTSRHHIKLIQVVLASSCFMLPSFSQAAVVINAPTGATTSAADDDTITITTTGEINVVGAAEIGLTITNLNNTVNIDATGAAMNAISATVLATDGINIQGANTTINIGENRTITAETDGIATTAATTTINNSGTITGSNILAGGSHGIDVGAGATGAVINNAASGTIQTGNATADAIQINETGATITNSGTIQAVVGGGAENAIDIQKSFTSITNNVGGFISSNDGNAILINGGAAVTGNITNSGTIQTQTGNAINITQILGGVITNNQGGVIQTTSAGASETILLDNSITSLNNSGTITALNGANAINVNKNISGDITNSSTGVIQSTDTTTLYIEDGLTGSITNAGDMTSTSAKVIDVNTGAITGSITNSATGTLETGNENALTMTTLVLDGDMTNAGTITNDSATSATVLSQTNSMFKSDFTNSGSITNANAAGDGLFLDLTTVNGSLTNTSTGTIEAGGVAFNLSNSTISTNLDNSGTIKGTSADTTFNINDSIIAGNFTNPGSISNTSTGTALSMDTVTVNGNMSNSGTSIIAGDANAILWTGVTIDGTFTNSGLIQNNSVGNATIRATGVNTVTGGFFNTGTIENLGGGTAIDFSNINVNIKLNQDGGSITGDVRLSGKGGSIFDMTGGTITGNVTGNGSVGSIFNLSGGTVTGNVTLSNALTGNIVNLSGTTITGTLKGGVGNDTVNISGGSFGTLDSTGGANTLNLDGSFTTTGTINNFQTVNVNAGTFTVANNMTNVNTLFNVVAGATTTASGAGNVIDGTGPLTNAGTFNILSGSSVDLGDTTNNGIIDIKANGLLTTTQYDQGAAGRLNVEILNSFAGPYIDVGVNPATLDAGTTLGATLSGGFIADGSQFNVINAGAGSDYNLGTLNFVQPASATVTFSPILNGTNLDLLASNVSFAQARSESIITDGVAGALDTIAATTPLTTDADLLNLLGQLQTLETSTQLEQALRTLVPNYNHALATGSSRSVHRAFDDIGIRLEELLGLSALLEAEDILRDEEDEEGLNYGDGDGSPLMRHHFGTWVKPYASIFNQRAREGVDGYRGDSIGFSMGADWHILHWATIGAALSLGKTDTSQRGLIDNNESIDSYQLTFYGQFDPIGPMYVNTMLGIARHRYSTHRNISVGALSKQTNAGFHGLQYAGKVDVGYAWFNGKYYLSPLASFTYTRLDMSNYSERGAGGLDLVVHYEPVSEVIGSLGFKVAMKNEYTEATYIPELAAFIHYDFQQDPQETLSNFVAGGPSFSTFGLKPDQTSFTISPSLRMHTHRNLMFKISYEFEAKQQFIAHSTYFRWYYKWS